MAHRGTRAGLLRWVLTQALLRYELRGTGVYARERAAVLRFLAHAAALVALLLAFHVLFWTPPTAPQPLLAEESAPEAPPRPVRVCAPSAPVQLDDGRPIPAIWIGQRC